MPHAHDGCYMLTMLTREKEREKARERETEGRKLVIFLTSCLCKYWQNVSRKGYPPLGVGDRNNNRPRDRNNRKNIFSSWNVILFNNILIIIIVIFIIIIMILWILHFYYIYTTDSTFILWRVHLNFGYYTDHHHDDHHHHFHWFFGYYSNTLYTTFIRGIIHLY